MADDAAAALRTLGYRVAEARERVARALERLGPEGAPLTLDSLIRKAISRST